MDPTQKLRVDNRVDMKGICRLEDQTVKDVDKICRADDIFISAVKSRIIMPKAKRLTFFHF